MKTWPIESIVDKIAFDRVSNEANIGNSSHLHFNASIYHHNKHKAWIEIGVNASQHAIVLVSKP